jgi:hypothetical protein
MDDVHALEVGTLQLPAEQPRREVPLGTEMALEWARSLGLRPGHAAGPRATALHPVVAAWAAERGWTPPGTREIGRGLAWATGVKRRLHPEDVAKLWRLVRAAWAPAYAPGDPRAKTETLRRWRHRKGAAPRLKPPPLPLFHEQLAKLGRKARPLCDSLGRVWPSGCVAAKALGGSYKAVDNARRLLADALTGTPKVSTSARILEAMRRGGTWRGVWWRHLTPAEVRAVPLEHRSGEPLPGLGWGLVCPRCGSCGVLAE